jgi:hypothetical protein
MVPPRAGADRVVRAEASGLASRRLANAASPAPLSTALAGGRGRRRHDGQDGPVIRDLHDGAVLASELLRIPLEVALEHSSELPEVDAYFFWEPVRGGGHIVVGRDGSVLFGISALSRRQLVDAFAEGRRTDRALFGPR